MLQRSSRCRESGGRDSDLAAATQAPNPTPVFHTLQVKTRILNFRAVTGVWGPGEVTRRQTVPRVWLSSPAQFANSNSNDTLSSQRTC